MCFEWGKLKAGTDNVNKVHKREWETLPLKFRITEEECKAERVKVRRDSRFVAAKIAGGIRKSKPYVQQEV